MIDRNGRMYVPVCDICDKALEDQFSFPDAVKAKRRAGWQSYQVDGVWIDRCPACRIKEAAHD